MASIKQSDITEYVESHIGEFHSRRLESLKILKLNDILSRKNPYLFRAKNILIPHDLVKGILDAHLSSQEEAIFGDFLENLAIYINSIVYGGRKSSAHGIDLEFSKEEISYIVSIKSGPNWGNSSQISKMKIDFRAAKKVLHTSNAKGQVIAINGCCYGKDQHPYKGEYYKYCGQDFWEFISGEEKLFLDIIQPLGHRAKEKNEEFIIEYSRMITRFTKDISENFCTNDQIDWEKLLKFNSGKQGVKD